MPIQSLVKESSPNTYSGSFTPDLIFSKLWLASKLNLLGLNKFKSIYILGSWFGNSAVFLNFSGIQANTVINVDINKDWLIKSKKLHDKLDLNYDLQYMNKDANSLDYRQLKKPSLVINTSINDMKNNGWFNNIPKNTLVALQGRNNVDSEAENNYNSIGDVVQAYPLTKVYFADEITLKDPETSYTRYMVIGSK